MGDGNNKKAVVLLSGGIDSSTALAVARSEGYALYALSFDYCQRHRRELESAKMVAKSFAVEQHLVITVDLREIGGSALTSALEVPKERVEDESGGTNEKRNTEERTSPFVPRSASSIPVTYVPARNTIFLSFGLAWAEVLGAEDIFIGANAVDYSGYPDCRPEYLRAFENMANLATKESVEGRLTFRIRAPLLTLTKAEIIKKGTELEVDYSLTWSCYDPQPKQIKAKVKAEKLLTSTSAVTSLIPCGRCESCRFREKGFRELGMQDPLLRVKNESL